MVLRGACRKNKPCFRYRKPISDDTLGLWVLVHPDDRRAARVRGFTDFIGNTFQADCDLFERL